MNLLLYFKLKTSLDDLFLRFGYAAIAIAICYGFCAMTSFQIRNGLLEESIRVKREEVCERRLLESRRRRIKRGLKHIGGNKYLRLVSPCVVDGCVTSRVDTLTIDSLAY